MQKLQLRGKCHTVLGALQYQSSSHAGLRPRLHQRPEPRGPARPPHRGRRDPGVHRRHLRKALRSPSLAELIDHARAGDRLCGTKLDRLGRSLREQLETVDSLKARGIHLVSREERLDTSSTAGELVFHLLVAIAHFNRRLISERTCDGIVAARRPGRTPGRPPLDEETILATQRRSSSMPAYRPAGRQDRSALAGQRPTESPPGYWCGRDLQRPLSLQSPSERLRAFPEFQAGRLLHYPFRGLLSVHRTLRRPACSPSTDAQWGDTAPVAAARLATPVSLQGGYGQFSPYRTRR